jgi:RimJ/RimL family protein N-acetyltransferase
MIGEVLLLPSTVREVELVMAFLPQHRCSGYGLEVAQAAVNATLKDPGVDTVISCVEDNNKAAKRLVEKLGMTQDGFMPRGDRKPRRYVLRK